MASTSACLAALSIWLLLVRVLRGRATGGAPRLLREAQPAGRADSTRPKAGKPEQLRSGGTPWKSGLAKPARDTVQSPAVAHRRNGTPRTQRRERCPGRERP